MHRPTAFAVVSQLMLLGAIAQNSTSGSGNATATCSQVDGAVQYNASTTRTISALKLSGPRPTTISEKFSLVEDDSHTWELSLRVRKQPNEDKVNTGRLGSGPYQQAMFLDTAGSNMTNIGSCHQTIQAEIGTGSFQWTREVVERSLKDSGDCTTLLGDECVQAMKKKAKENAAEFPLRNGRCNDMNSSLPEECSGVGPQFQDRRKYLPRLGVQQTTDATKEMNLTYLSGIAEGYLNTQFDPSLKCNDVNVSSTHSVTVAERMAYDAAVRFPVIDVITFWPNRSNGMQAFDNRWPEDVHVEVVCMRPDSNIAEGSETPPSALDMLAKGNVTFPSGSGASALVGYGAFGIMSAAVTAIMLAI